MGIPAAIASVKKYFMSESNVFSPHLYKSSMNNINQSKKQEYNLQYHTSYQIRILSGTSEVHIFPDHEKPGSRCHLSKCTIDLRGWEFGTGREWGGDGKGEVSLRVT